MGRIVEPSSLTPSSSARAISHLPINCPLGRHYIRRERLTGNRAETSAYFPGPALYCAPLHSPGPGGPPSPARAAAVAGVAWLDFYSINKESGFFYAGFRGQSNFAEICPSLSTACPAGVTPILLHSRVSSTQWPVAVNLASTLGLCSFLNFLH